jgi:hypothetical protein
MFRLDEHETRIRSTKLQDTLRTWAIKSGIRYLDLMDSLVKAKTEDSALELFYPLDQHFTAAGNKIAARAIGDTLLEMRTALTAR